MSLTDADSSLAKAKDAKLTLSFSGPSHVCKCKKFPVADVNVREFHCMTRLVDGQWVAVMLGEPRLLHVRLQVAPRLDLADAMTTITVPTIAGFLIMVSGFMREALEAEGPSKSGI
jgi:hypothetical protein